MKKLKSLISHKFEILSLLFTAIVMSSILLIFRIKLNKSFFYLFLIWNLFLAIIPYAITMYLSSTKLNKVKLGLWFWAWLLFLPNAPYIITDLLHLKVSRTSILWLDILVILSFALTGLFLFYLSLSDMKVLISQHFKKIPIKTLSLSIILLCGFGVYLGRFLRYNSWEIISNPTQLITDILDMILNPSLHADVWLFTFGFGGFLCVGYWMFSQFIKQIKPKDL